MTSESHYGMNGDIHLCIHYHEYHVNTSSAGSSYLRPLFQVSRQDSNPAFQQLYAFDPAQIRIGW
jgi:hypothetical protein